MQSPTAQQIEGNWDQFKGKIKESWGKLTDDDLKRAEGKYDQLVGVIKERTGESRAAIEKRLDEISAKAKTLGRK